jgi:hypothetical protein
MKRFIHNSNYKFFIITLLILGWVVSSFPLKAQFYNGSQLSFGKNRVQYQKFNWTYYRTTQFDVYFYPTGKMLAQYTMFKAPQFMDEIERLFNFAPTKKLQFIVYNTQSDFRESNFAYDDDDFYNQGGVTNIYGTKAYLYFDGNHRNFDAMIRSGIANIYARLIVEGQSVGSNISAATLFNVPNWYYSGLASYIGEHWNSLIDAHVKDGILTQRYADFDELSPREATYAGHSFWKYVADIYGENTISTILYATRSSKSIEKGFYYGTGVGYRQLLANWYRYYYALYKKDMKRTMPEEVGIVQKAKRKRDYAQIKIAPNGEDYAYSTNEAGQIKVWVKTAEMKKAKVIFRKFQKTEDNPDLTFPLINWHPQGGMLGFTIEDKGRCYYYPYDVESGKLDDRLLVDVEKITDFSFSDDGKLLLFSGFKNGQSDIFLYSFKARSIQYVTKDVFDDYAPKFIDNQRKIIFSSNRNHDTLNTQETFFTARPQSSYDLFLYDYKHKDNQLLRVTNTPYANETEVKEGAEGILFLGDETGIVNRYSARFDSTISRIDTAIHYAYSARVSPLTDNAYSILEHDYDAASGQVADIVLNGNVKKIYIHPVEEKLSQPAAPSSFQRQMRAEQRQRDSLAAAKKSLRKSGSTKHGFYQVRRSDLQARGDSLRTARQPKGLSGNLADGFEFIQQVPRNYYVQYTVNKLVTQADFSFLNTTYQQFTGDKNPIYLNAGLNALVMVGIHDLFEDYRISAGFRLSFDLDNNEVMLSYENLARRLDRQVVVYRQSLKSYVDQYLYKQHNNSIFYILKYPFNKTNSLRLQFTGRYETYIMAGLNDYSLEKKDERHVWGGVKLEYVFDSSKELAVNLWRGSKIKIFAEYNHRIDKDMKNLLVVGFDARKSVKVFRNMTWATRLAGSTNFGTSRLIYYMGGIDNWILAKFNSGIWVDPSKGYAYQTLATNMRGFEQNIRNGTSFVVLSTELRMPIVQMFTARRISSNFLKSLQLVLFGDFGTAWTGLTPYSKENSLYTRIVESGSISAKVHRQVEPFIGGFGLGLRASVLGYFLKLDYAWGVEDYKIYKKRGMLMFSIGTDF